MLYKDRTDLAEVLAEVLGINVRLSTIPAPNPPEALLVEAEPFIDLHEQTTFSRYQTHWLLKIISKTSADDVERVKNLDGYVDKLLNSPIAHWIDSISAYQASPAADSQPYLTALVTLKIPLTKGEE